MTYTPLLVLIGAALGVANLVLVALELWQGALRLGRTRAQIRSEAAVLAERLTQARLALRRAESVGPWNGTRKFQISRIIAECEGVKSFYLKPHDGRPLPGFYPGQFLTFEMDIPGERRRTVRCYSLSDRPGRDYYRVTIKAVPSPADKPGVRPGLVSNFFHHSLKEGDIVDVKAPSGGFHLDTEKMGPLVLIAGGVGATPMASMLHYVASECPCRDVWFFLGVRNGSDHLLKAELEALAAANDRFRVHVCYSKPRPEDTPRRDYRHKGHVTAELLRAHLPSNNFEYYLCGPGQMMQDMHDGLLAWGAPAESIHLEAFGPASVKTSRGSPPAPVSETLTVRFSKSRREIDWTGQADSLLDFAIQAQIPMDSGCRAGGCGSCKTAVKSGKVKYLKKPGCDVEAGSCLTCISVPETALELEA